MPSDLSLPSDLATAAHCCRSAGAPFSVSGCSASGRSASRWPPVCFRYTQGSLLCFQLGDGLHGTGVVGPGGGAGGGRGGRGGPNRVGRGSRGGGAVGLGGTTADGMLRSDCVAPSAVGMARAVCRRWGRVRPETKSFGGGHPRPSRAPPESRSRPPRLRPTEGLVLQHSPCRGVGQQPLHALTRPRRQPRDAAESQSPGITQTWKATHK